MKNHEIIIILLIFSFLLILFIFLQINIYYVFVIFLYFILSFSQYTYWLAYIKIKVKPFIIFFRLKLDHNFDYTVIFNIKSINLRNFFFEINFQIKLFFFIFVFDVGGQIHLILERVVSYFQFINLWFFKFKFEVRLNFETNLTVF